MKTSIYSRWWLWLALAVLLAVVHGWSLLRYPLPTVDEAWLLSRAQTFARTGQQFGVLDSGVVDAWPAYWTVNQWLITALHSVAISLPLPILLAGRLFSLLAGAGLLLAGAIIARRMLGVRAAWWATLLTGLSPAFFYASHVVRYDILAAALAYSALACLVWMRLPGLWRGLLAGILIGLAIETHLNGLIFVLVVLGWEVIRWGWRGVWRQREVWGLAAGGLVGGLLYAVLHIFPAPQTFLEVNRLVFGATQKVPLLNPAGWLEALGATGVLLLATVSGLAIAALIALPWALRHVHAGVRLAGWTALIVGLGIWFIIPNKGGHYAIWATPAFIWLAVWALQQVWQQPWRGRLMDYLGRVAVLGAVLSTLLLSALPLMQNGYALYTSAQAQINARIRPGDRIMGSQTFWLGLQDHPYQSWELLFYYPRVQSGATLADAFAHYQPDVLIVDAGVRNLIRDDIEPGTRWESYHLSQRELETFMAQQGAISETFEAEGYGPITLYRLKWSQP